MSSKIYSYQSKIYAVPEKGGAYTIFPYNVREEFGKGRAKVHVTFDNYPYNGSVVNMGIKDEEGNVCYIIGIRKDIQKAIGKSIGDTVTITVTERE
ncbi:hypothetical protein A9Q68_02470 [Streptococcus bovimastitidis]|uniref:Enoyl-ACP reductase n=1 Tax=Streptococcus bovimastitidis TaxID=1856638 RepID=A0A1L8MP31_9STRE|nr:DUF1905 domain-containing protein [Streptococcus bovimastitidis]OJF72425.1 hypothetical protein A9Q68_02470 [Streptococcus bovimastitidis]